MFVIIFLCFQLSLLGKRKKNHPQINGLFLLMASLTGTHSHSSVSGLRRMASLVWLQVDGDWVSVSVLSYSKGLLRGFF